MKIPNLEPGESTWVIYGKTSNMATETHSRSTAELAARHGQKVVTAIQHLKAVQKDVDAGGDGSNAKSFA